MENKPQVGTLTFTKELFVSIIGQMQKQSEHDKKCSEAFGVILPDDFVTTYNNYILYDQLIELLQLAMNDPIENSIITYFIWDLEYGKNWEKEKVLIDGKEYQLRNASDLWDALNINGDAS